MTSLYDIQLDIYNYLLNNAVPVVKNSNDSTYPCVSIDISLKLDKSASENGFIFSKMKMLKGSSYVDVIRTPFVCSMLLSAGKNKDIKNDKIAIEKLVKQVYFLLLNYKSNNYNIKLYTDTLQIAWRKNGILDTQNNYETEILITIEGAAIYE